MGTHPIFESDFDCLTENVDRELGEFGGAGHYFGDDKMIEKGGPRDDMEEAGLKKVLKLLSAGEKKINVKFWWDRNWEVAEAGWTIQFKTFRENYGGDGENYHLWISKKDATAKFKATAQEIDFETGEEFNRRELQSEEDGTGQRIKYEKDLELLVFFVRFNITML